MSFDIDYHLGKLQQYSGKKWQPVPYQADSLATCQRWQRRLNKRMGYAKIARLIGLSFALGFLGLAVYGGLVISGYYWFYLAAAALSSVLWCAMEFDVIENLEDEISEANVQYQKLLNTELKLMGMEGIN